MDLSDMSHLKHNGFKFMMVIIDCLSRFGWAVAIRDKKPESIIIVLKKIFKERKPQVTFYARTHNSICLSLSL